MSITSVAVFCGSSQGNQPEYIAAARELAKCLVEANLSLVYGGGRLGLMGAIADETLALGGRVIGVMPEKLIKREYAHTSLHSLHIVPSMHERKVMMNDIADAFIMMPGGIGSLDEFFEVITLNKLDYLNKPAAILNTNNYYDALIQFLNHSVQEGFYEEKYNQQIIVDTKPSSLLDKIVASTATPIQMEAAILATV